MLFVVVLLFVGIATLHFRIKAQKESYKIKSADIEKIINIL